MILFYGLDFYLITIISFLSYMIGSISFGLVIAKFMNLGNLRAIGSGNVGATNVLRTGSKIAAALTVILDSGKGYVATLATIALFGEAYLPFASIAVFMGHIFPIYHKFRGGKGVATFLGIILASSPAVGLLVCCTWLITAFISKRSSVAALSASLGTPFFLFLSQPDQKVLLFSVLGLLIWWLHRGNIKRLILKTEPKISLKKN